MTWCLHSLYVDERIFEIVSLDYRYTSYKTKLSLKDLKT
jgi:hypothetical protein